MLNIKESLEKYGSQKLYLQEYYKYTFTFMDKDGWLKVIAGGLSDSIYRLKITTEMYLEDIIHNTACIIEANGKIVYKDEDLD